MSIKLVTFDLDDTFWDCEPVILKAESIFFAWLECEYPDIASSFTPQTIVEHRRVTFAKFKKNQHDLSFLRKRWLGVLGEEFGYGDALVQSGFEIFWHARNDVTLYPSVLKMLEKLRGSYQLATITNGNADVYRIGIGHWFDAVVTAADANCAKPSGGIFDYALRQLGVRAEEAVHVGDDPINDVLGAKNHGMRSIWINPKRLPWRYDGSPDADILNVGELVSALNSLNE